MYNPNEPYSIPQQVTKIEQKLDSTYYDLNITVDYFSPGTVVSAINALASQVAVPDIVNNIQLSVRAGTQTTIIYFRKDAVAPNGVMYFRNLGYINVRILITDGVISANEI